MSHGGRTKRATGESVGSPVSCGVPPTGVLVPLEELKQFTERVLACKN